jgi:hypothetical protein
MTTTEAYLDDDGGPQVTAVEAADSTGHRQALHVRVGPVFYGDSNPAKNPGVWIEYQEEHMKSSLTGPVLLTPAVWRELVHVVEMMLQDKEEEAEWKEEEAEWH